MSRTIDKWWMQFPKIESRTLRAPGPDDKPRLAVGSVVRLRGKPDRLRRVTGTEWHGHRYEFIYIVETSAPAPFQPYWFFDQLLVEPPAITPRR